MKLRVAMGPRDPQISYKEVKIINPCCDTFLNAAQQGALRFFAQVGGAVFVYVLKPILIARPPVVPGPSTRLRYCPWCGSAIK